MAKKAKTASAGRTAHGGGRGKYVRHTYNTTTAEKKQPIYDANGRVIGSLIGDTFHRTAKGSVHMLRKPPAWAVDACVLPQLHEGNGQKVTGTDTETGTTYTATLATFERYAIHLNRGYGPQRALPLGYWSVDGKPPKLGQPQQPKPDSPRQLVLPLFEGLAA